MADSEDSKLWHRYREAMSTSTRLMQQEQNDAALSVLNDAIAMAVDEKEVQWILTLSHHAAVVSNFSGKPELVKRYYEQSLSYSPENPRALLGLAVVSLDQGNPELATTYAVRCYESLQTSDHFLKDSYLETLLSKWPELAPPSSR